jgi:hypothetical protein
VAFSFSFSNCLTGQLKFATLFRMVMNATHLCITDKLKKVLVSLRENPALQSCTSCGFKILLRVPDLPEEFYSNWPGSIRMFESLFPYCYACQADMIASSLGWSESNGTFSKGVCFVCPSNENHVLDAYDTKIEKQEYHGRIDDAFRNAISLLLQERVDPTVQQDGIETIHVVSNEIDGTKEIDLTNLPAAKRAAFISEFRWYEAQGVLHDVQENGNRLKFRPDPRVLEALLPRSTTMHQ